MKKSNLKKLVMMTLAMGALYVPGLASAEEAAAPQEFALDEVVVTANRMENKLVDTPANVAVVTAEEIERRNYQDVIEAVKNVPGVNVVEGASGDDHVININGSERVLVLVNGRRVGSAQGFSSGKPKVDATMLPNPSSIERIEIVKGGGSTVYGTDAVGGVINIITKKADSNSITMDVNTGSWGTQNYKLAATVKEGRTGVFVAAGKAKQNYMKYKENSSRSNLHYPNSSSDNRNINLKIEQEVGDDQLLTLTYDHLNKKGGRPGAVYASYLPAPYYNLDRGHKIDNNIALRYDWNTDAVNTGYVQVYNNNSVNDWENQMKTNEKKIGFDIQQTIKTSDKNTMVVGGSYWKADVNTKGMSPDYDVPNDYNESVNTKAVFVQDSWDFAHNWKLNTGLRYDNHSKASSRTTASIAVNKKINEVSHAYVSWSQVFNAPSTDDLYTRSHSWGAWNYGNPDLKPEKGDTYSAGYETQIGRKTNVGVSGFYSELDDAIKWDPVDPSILYGDWIVKNIEKQKRRGLEVNYKYQFDDRWSAFANYTYVKVENKNGSSDYERDLAIQPNQYKLGVAYTNDKWNIDLIGRGASGGAKQNYCDSKYLTLDLSVNYKIKDNWKFYVKGYNLTNASYTEQAGTYNVGTNVNYKSPAAGRRFLVGTQVTF